MGPHCAAGVVRSGVRHVRIRLRTYSLRANMVIGRMPSRADPASLEGMNTYLARAASAWSLIFGVFHFYWAVGGSFGLGDGPASKMMSESPGFLVYDLVVGVLCLLGAVFALALGGRHFQRIPRKLVLIGAWTATVALLLRGFPGLLEDVLVATDVLSEGLLGMSNMEIYGEAHPSAYTIWSMRIVDVYFTLGALLFLGALRAETKAHHTHDAPTAARHASS